jgi:tetratricopeptide (TPR) repeat protein/transglutaminase-like putative cysteine protease
MFRHRRTSGQVSFPLCAALVVACQITASAQKPAASGDYSQEALVFEQIRSRMRFENDGTGTRELQMRVRTQNEGGVQQFGQLVFGYNSANERTEIASVRVRKPDGTVVVTPPEAVQDLSSPVERIAPIYTDFRQKHVTVQSLRPGDVLEVSVVTTIHTALAPGQFWIDYNFEDDAVVLDEQFELDIPAGRRVILKTRSGFDVIPKEANGRRLYRWAQTQLKGTSALKTENDERRKTDTRPADEPEPSAIRLTTFETWDDVGRWYAALERSPRVPTPEIRKKAIELTAGRTTDLEKIEALYQFVATNFRYVSLSLGLGRYQPRPSAAVLQEQYGDCKDKHTLLASLLEAAGLRASAVLINTAIKIDPEFPSPSQFNHVITLTRAGNDDVWLDTTTEVAPFRLLASSLRNKQGLVVDAAKPRLERTPANPPMKSLVSQVVDGTLESGGKLTAHIRMTVRGDVEFLMRAIFRRAPPARWKEVLEEFVKASGDTGDLSNWKVSDPAALRDPFSVEFDLAVPRYADWTSKRITVALPLTASPMLSAAGIDHDDATAPVQLGAAPTDVSYSLRMTLPADVTARAPLPVKQTRDYGAYRGDYAVKGNVLTAERVMTVLISEVPAERRQDVAAFLKVVASDAAQKLSLETSSAISPSTTAPDLTAAQLNRRGYDALQAGNHAEAVTLLKRVVELEPKDSVAWNNLGLAHAGLRQWAPAIDAYQKQIAVNPYDQYAYNNLGRAYVAARDYDKAEAAFLKQLEVNPLDRYTPSNLGALYLTRRNYERAAEQFDKAIALDPENSWVQTQAGKAYLNLKQVDKAMAAFDRAVEKAPSPSTWNNVAYELSLHGLQLDRAQQYAESAVSSATAASRTIEVSRGDAASLGVVRTLATYWDTLGWVHFARGDMAKALPYVEMAWKLAQHGEVGDHLAQIYEKQGRRDDAIKTYALAMSASQPSNDARGHLEALLKDGRTVTSVVDSTRQGLTDMRTFKVAAKAAANATAEFLLLFSTPGTVDAVRFISGDESLRPVAEAIRATSFGSMFPSEAPAKILRRGLMACTPTSGCVITLILPDDAQPVK